MGDPQTSGYADDPVNTTTGNFVEPEADLVFTGAGASLVHIMKLKCYAKINWALDVVGKRQDGYHDVDSLLQSVDVYDTLQVELHTEDILYGYGHAEPILDLYNDLCFKAVKEFRKQTSIQDKFCIKLNKNIPIGAGMGGGSADAADVL